MCTLMCTVYILGSMVSESQRNYYLPGNLHSIDRSEIGFYKMQNVFVANSFNLTGDLIQLIKHIIQCLVDDKLSHCKLYFMSV